MTRARRVASSASRSSDGTRRSCTTPRSTRRASTLATSCSSSTRTRWRTPSARRAAPTGSASASPRHTSAWSPGLCDEVEPDADTIGAVNNVVRRRRRQPARASTATRPASGPAWSWRWAARWTVPRSWWPGPAGRPTPWSSRASRPGARDVIVGNRTAGPRRRSCERFACGRARRPVGGRPGRSGVRRRRSGRRTWRSTRRRSACSIPATTIAVERAAAARRPCSTWSTSRPRRRSSRAARARGLRAANGSEMLIAQAAIAFERWTGVGGMADVMRAAVAPLLADASARA